MTTVSIGFVLHMAGFYSAGRAADMLAQARNTGRLHMGWLAGFGVVAGVLIVQATRVQ